MERCSVNSNQSSAINNYVQIIAENRMAKLCITQNAFKCTACLNKFVSNHLRSKRFCGHVERCTSSVCLGLLYFSAMNG